ncbi:hypothetical protein BKA81DRAFT_11740 [Phyllosticta paracitricarpa]|uniref:Uncharacterized protein n=1 Tax=Phyllosticta paracitricarpa TaxID=2016321 RepID=A0ABR1N8T1_9PEZI
MRTSNFLPAKMAAIIATLAAVPLVRALPVDAEVPPHSYDMMGLPLPSSFPPPLPAADIPIPNPVEKRDASWTAYPTVAAPTQQALTTEAPFMTLSRLHSGDGADRIWVPSTKEIRTSVFGQAKMAKREDSTLTLPVSPADILDNTPKEDVNANDMTDKTSKVYGKASTPRPPQCKGLSDFLCIFCLKTGVECADSSLSYSSAPRQTRSARPTAYTFRTRSAWPTAYTFAPTERSRPTRPAWPITYTFARTRRHYRPTMTTAPPVLFSLPPVEHPQRSWSREFPDLGWEEEFQKRSVDKSKRGIIGGILDSVTGNKNDKSDSSSGVIDSVTGKTNNGNSDNGNSNNGEGLLNNVVESVTGDKDGNSKKPKDPVQDIVDILTGENNKPKKNSTTSGGGLVDTASDLLNGKNNDDKKNNGNGIVGNLINNIFKREPFHLTRGFHFHDFDNKDEKNSDAAAADAEEEDLDNDNSKMDAFDAEIEAEVRAQLDEEERESRDKAQANAQASTRRGLKAAHSADNEKPCNGTNALHHLKIIERDSAGNEHLRPLNHTEFAALCRELGSRERLPGPVPVMKGKQDDVDARNATSIGDGDGKRDINFHISRIRIKGANVGEGRRSVGKNLRMEEE